MIVETLVVLALVVSGSLVVRTAGLTGWAVPAVGLPVGLAVHVGLTGMFVVTSVAIPVWVPVALTVTAAVAWWLRCRRRGESVAVSPIAATAVAIAVAGLVATLRVANLLNVTPDSFRYLTTSGLLASQRLDSASPFLLESRLVTVPAMHAPAALGGELYLRSVTPLVAVACVLVLAWLARAGIGQRTLPPTPEVVAVLAAALLVTNNRFVFHAFYLNGHLAAATWLLIVAGISWLLMTGAASVDARPRLVALQALVIPALVLTRPETGLLVALALLPLLVAQHVPRSLRWVPAAALGASMAVWQGFLAVAYRTTNGTAPASATGLTIVGFALLVGAVALRARGSGWLPRRVLGLAEAGLWLLLVVLVVTDPGVLAASAKATLFNVLSDGGWGVSLLVLAALAIAALLLTAAPGRVTLRFPLTAFVPFSLLLAYLRDGAYRLGPGDSLNRILLHILPLAILFVASAFASDRWEWPRRAAQPRRGGG